MADTATHARYTLAEFLEWEELQDTRHQLVDGAAHAMAGGTRRHSRVKVNIVTALRNRLRGTPCEAFDSDFKVVTADGSSFYPDATVDCGVGDDSSVTAAEPTIVFEVLSKRTQKEDFEIKLPRYQATPSIRQIVYVEPDKMLVTVWRRGARGWRKADVAPPVTKIALEPVGATLLFEEIYEGVRFAK